MASKASYVYILNGQKFIKNAKNGQLWRVFGKPEACGQTELLDRSILIGQKLVENAKIEKFKCDILGDFQTLCKGYWSSLNWCRYARDSQELKQNYFEDLLDDPEDRIFGAFVLGKYEDGKTFRSVRSDIKLKCRKI